MIYVRRSVSLTQQLMMLPILQDCILEMEGDSSKRNTLSMDNKHIVSSHGKIKL